jgi:hypothetical protein
MDRCKEYFCFAFSFAGLGTIVLWLLTSRGHPLALSPALEEIGMLSAIFFITRMLLLAIRRLRRQPTAPAAVAATPRLAAARPLRRKALRPPAPVKPRSHFGLRGMPH